MSQSVGLVKAMEPHVALRSVQVFGRITARGWLHPIIRLIMWPDGRPLPQWLLRKVAKVEIPSDASAPDLIISSGGKSIVPARTLARRFDVPYVFVGLGNRYPSNWFHTMITHVPTGARKKNAIEVELIPTPVTPALIAAQGDVENGTWGMMIGGASQSHRFDDQDWSALAESMNHLAERENIRWLLTTSRRTGIAAERILRRTLHPSSVRDAIWWSEQPRRELYQFMARSELLFVTQDSVTMLTEAVSSGKPVVAVRPNGRNTKYSKFNEAYFERLEKRGRMARVALEQLSLFSPRDVTYDLLDHAPLHGPIDELLRRLQWVS